MKSLEIKNKIYWVGIVDWGLRDFHGYSTEKGSSYNAFLAMDDQITLFDTVKAPFFEEMWDRIKDIVDPSKIENIVINHVEMDHTGSLPLFMERIKPKRIICSQKGKENLIAHFHHPEWPYHVVKTGDTLNIGKNTVKFIETPMLHWPDSMFSYIESQKLLISSDAFGQHYASSERFDDEIDNSELVYQTAKYYANILLPYSSLIQRLLKTVSELGLQIDMIAPDHGVIWKNPAQAISLYDKYSRGDSLQKAVVVYDTMWHSTEAMARAVTDGLVREGISVRLMGLHENNRSEVITELLDAKAIVVGSSTLNNEVLPTIADVLTYVKGLKPFDKIGASISSYGWNPKVLKDLNTTLEALSIKVVEPGINVRFVPTAEDIKNCREMGKRLAGHIKG